MIDGDTSTEQVYLIGTPGSSVVKIGRSRNVFRRLAALQGMSPVPLSVLHTFAGGAALEAALHRYFHALRTHGEWFDFGTTAPVPAVTAAVALGENLLKHRSSAKRPSGQSLGWPTYDRSKPHWVYPEEPEPGRCACGHQAASHGSQSPHPCGGQVPFNGKWCENFCLCGKYDDSPATYAKVRVTHPRNAAEWAVEA